MTNNSNTTESLSPVRVEWYDACTHNAWYTKDQVESFDVLFVETVGFLLENREDALIVALTVSEVGASDIIVIPKVSVISWYVYKGDKLK